MKKSDQLCKQFLHLSSPTCSNMFQPFFPALSNARTLKAASSSSGRAKKPSSNKRKPATAEAKVKAKKAKDKKD